MSSKGLQVAGGLLAVAAVVALAVGVGPAQAAFPGTNGQIAFASDRNGAQDVYAMTADGVIQGRLTDAAGDDQYPVWSPDGQQIVFSSQRELRTGEFPQHKIFKMNADGSAETRIADTAFEDLEPSWSPNMGRIAFRRDGAGDTSHIWSMDASSGAGLQQLTEVGNNLNPMWSPTADTIAFASHRDGSDYEIFLMDGNGDN
jgi:TolB protein